MTECYCDYNPAEVYWAKRPIARTIHKCNECSGTIQPSERYERVRAKWDGEMVTVNTCVYCLALRDLIESRAACFCWAHGAMIEDAIHLHWQRAFPCHDRTLN